MSDLPLYKIKRSGERIWVQATEAIGENGFKGVVDSHTLNPDGVQYGDEIMFRKGDIIDVWREQ